MIRQPAPKPDVMAPGVDYHWYRLGNDGYWSHKPGVTPATDVDDSAPHIAGGFVRAARLAHQPGHAEQAHAAPDSRGGTLASCA